VHNAPSAVSFAPAQAAILVVNRPANSGPAADVPIPASDKIVRNVPLGEMTARAAHPQALPKAVDRSRETARFSNRTDRNPSAPVRHAVNSMLPLPQQVIAPGAARLLKAVLRCDRAQPVLFAMTAPRTDRVRPVSIVPALKNGASRTAKAVPLAAIAPTIGRIARDSIVPAVATAAPAVEARAAHLARTVQQIEKASPVSIALAEKAAAVSAAELVLNAPSANAVPNSALQLLALAATSGLPRAVVRLEGQVVLVQPAAGVPTRAPTARAAVPSRAPAAIAPNAGHELDTTSQAFLVCDVVPKTQLQLLIFVL